MAWNWSYSCQSPLGARSSTLVSGRALNHYATFPALIFRKKSKPFNISISKFEDAECVPKIITHDTKMG